MPLHIANHTPHVVLVTIDNEAKRNAMSRQMLADLAGLWDRLDTDTACRCVVVTGAGSKAFCAGADISGDLSASPEMARVINRGLLKTSTFSRPVIAAVNGVCAGGGVELSCRPTSAPACRMPASACRRCAGRSIRSAAPL